MTILKTEKTIQAYNKNATKYKEKFNDFSPYKKKIIEFQDQFIPKGARILDLGCGPGNNITTIKSLDDSCQFTGIDLSEGLLAIAKKIHPSCEFINQNICDLSAKGLELYEAVIASFCIVHLDNEETVNVLKFISESLVQGGSLYLSFMEGTVSGFETTSFSTEEIYFNYYQLDYVLGLLKENDLIPKMISKEDYLEQDGSITSDIFIYALKE
ncbi:bifunctional 2-polyprenyl-6-hydroxyphenol methylase/3-demethylubiquinol 3-O-methyltransferase UbiG [Desulforhopalus sp. IMCC35007]|uniref:class I SAM-dependent methyltransferase n=1 Tax=Desulforhopalus sp. IMCC35007 TaxID=2569543 RepID=UPI0010ADBFAF|nr:class I SAM-dependent methyltransferase [Desulforhopalus sp. IMCC35007]TKB07577.1 class I SAM-dependent methyltransferase [Desulforhopalus sp. IMCC35007]